jgi:hypothetical protein
MVQPTAQRLPPRRLAAQLASLAGQQHEAGLKGVLGIGTAAQDTWNLAPVEGTVTMHGCPLAHIEVVFLVDVDAGTQGPKASGTTDKSGHYRLRSHNGDDGAVTGKHRVLLIDLEAAMNMKQRGRGARGSQQKDPAGLSPEMAKRLEEQLKPAVEAPRVPPSYGRFNESPLRAEVRPGPQTLDFDLR